MKKTTEINLWSPGSTCKADILPNESIRLYGTNNGTAFDKTFFIGDAVVTGSYNLMNSTSTLSKTLGQPQKLIHTGTVVDIGKTVSVSYHGNLKCMKFDAFARANHDLDLNYVREHNAKTMMYLKP